MLGTNLLLGSKHHLKNQRHPLPQSPKLEGPGGENQLGRADGGSQSHRGVGALLRVPGITLDSDGSAANLGGNLGIT